MVIALLKRVGLGPFDLVIDFVNLPTGPLAPGADGTDGLGHFTALHRDPLYLVLTSTIVWGDPAATTYKSVITYDPKYVDMSVITTGPAGNGWQPSSAINIPADYAVDYIGLSFNGPGDDPNGTFVYDGGRNQITTAGPLLITIQSETYTDSNSVTHYGYTYTQVLSSPFTWEQYAEIADSFLDGVTLQDGTLAPDKTYPFTWNGVNFNAKLRYFCEFPKNNTDPNYTNVLCVRADRTAKDGYVFGTIASLWGADINPEWGSWSFNSTQAVSQPCGAVVPVNGIDNLLPRYPLAAHGMPTTRTPPNPTNDPALIVSGGIPGAPTLSGHSLFSCKTSVRAKTDLAQTATVIIYDPVTDTVQQNAGVVSAGPGEYLFGPEKVQGIGCLIAIYAQESICTTSDVAFLLLPIHVAPTMPQGGKPIFLGRGKSQTFYCVTYDSRGNWLRNRGGAWSLQAGGAGIGAITGACLVPAADGLSAVFTAPAGAGEAFLVVDIPGLTYQLGIVVIVN